MKSKVLFLMLIILISLSIFGCSPQKTTETKNYRNTKISFLNETPYTVTNDFSGASISIAEFSSDNKFITIDITYSGDYTLSYGTSYEIEALIGSKWYTINYDKLDHTGIAYHIKDGESRSEIYNLTRYGELPTGHYRIVKEVLDFIETDNYTKHHLTAEFDIE